MITLVIYTWTILWFFWKLPSWLYFLNASEIGIALAYVLVTNFVESLLVLCIPVFLALVLPRKWFLDLFVARGTCLVLFGLGYMIYLAREVQTKVDHPAFSYRLLPLAIAAVLILMATFLISRIGPIRKILEAFSDRATIFLYVFMPVSVISMLVVLVRLFA